MNVNKEYAVGYGRPPTHTRFKPGQSGNPKGRPPGAKNLKTELMEELHEEIQIREGEQLKTVTKQRAVLKSLMAKALKGEARAARLLIIEMASTFLHEESEGVTIVLSAEDQSVL